MGIQVLTTDRVRPVLKDQQLVVVLGRMILGEWGRQRSTVSLQSRENSIHTATSSQRPPRPEESLSNYSKEWLKRWFNG